MATAELRHVLTCHVLFHLFIYFPHAAALEKIQLTQGPEQLVIYEARRLLHIPRCPSVRLPVQPKHKTPGFIPDSHD